MLQSSRIRRWVKERAAFLRAVNGKGGKCQECGEDHIAVLDFHHRDDTQKDNHISWMVKRKGQESKLDVELSKCDLLCSNCHRKRHFDQLKWDEHAEEILQRATGWKPKRDPSCKRITELEIKRIRQWIGEGFSLEKIGLKLGRNPNGLRRSIKRLHAEGLIPEFASYKPKRASKTSVDNAEVLRLWDEGLSVAEIASNLGCGVRPVYDALRSARDGKQEPVQVEVAAGEPQAV